jgi:hypothetical protein
MNDQQRLIMQQNIANNPAQYQPQPQPTYIPPPNYQPVVPSSQPMQIPQSEFPPVAEVKLDDEPYGPVKTKGKIDEVD